VITVTDKEISHSFRFAEVIRNDIYTYNKIEQERRRAAAPPFITHRLSFRAQHFCARPYRTVRSGGQQKAVREISPKLPQSLQQKIFPINHSTSKLRNKPYKPHKPLSISMIIHHNHKLCSVHARRPCLNSGPVKDVN